MYMNSMAKQFVILEEIAIQTNKYKEYSTIYTFEADRIALFSSHNQRNMEIILHYEKICSISCVWGIVRSINGTSLALLGLCRYLPQSYKLKMCTNCMYCIYRPICSAWTPLLIEFPTLRYKKIYFFLTITVL